MTSVNAVARALRVLVCDADPAVRQRLSEVLLADHLVATVDTADSLGSVRQSLPSAGIDIVFVDLFTFGIYEASDLIFAFRRKSPGAVFVMHADDELFTENASFFFGERRRLLHYYRLARHLGDAKIAGEVHAVLVHCMMDLGLSPQSESAGLRA